MEKRKISSFVFLDLESTGLASSVHHPRITELSLVAVHRTSLVDPVSPLKQNHPSDETICQHYTPRVLNKLSVCVYPMKVISPHAAEITGLYNDNLYHQKDFDHNLGLSLALFLKRLVPPVCLLAHNGNAFDFPLLKVELKQAGFDLDQDILCADTLHAFKEMDKISPSPTDSRPLSRKPDPTVSVDSKQKDSGHVSKTERINVIQESGENRIVDIGNWDAPGTTVSTDYPQILNNTTPEMQAIKATQLRNISAKLHHKEVKISSGEDRILRNQHVRRQLKFGSPTRGVVPLPSSKRPVDKSEQEYHDVKDEVNTGVSVNACSDQKSTICSKEPMKSWKAESLDQVEMSTLFTDLVSDDDLCQLMDTIVDNSESPKVRETEKGSSATCMKDQHINLVQFENVSICSDKNSQASEQPAESNTENVIEVKETSNKEAEGGLPRPVMWSAFPSPAGSLGSSTASPGGTPTPSKRPKLSYKLSSVHQRVLGCMPLVMHTAEDDCLTLLRICYKMAPCICNWIDEHAVPFTEIKPMYEPRNVKQLPPDMFPYQL